MSPFLALLVPPLKGNRNPSTVHAIIPMFLFSSFFSLFFFHNQSTKREKSTTMRIIRKMKRNSLNFSVLYLPTFQEMDRVTVTTTEIIQHKQTYRCSGHSFSGSSGSSSKSNRNLLAYRRNLIFLSFSLFLKSNQSTTMRVNFYIYITKKCIVLQQ